MTINQIHSNMDRRVITFFRFVNIINNEMVLTQSD